VGAGVVSALEVLSFLPLMNVAMFTFGFLINGWKFLNVYQPFSSWKAF
jgi:hypothetical protein